MSSSAAASAAATAEKNNVTSNNDDNSSANNDSNSDKPDAKAAIQTNPAQQEELLRFTEDMFTKVGLYLAGELQATQEDYKLLEQMNMVTKDKYTSMADNAARLVNFMEDLQEKYKTFEPFLAKIDEIEKGVSDLETTVVELDKYSQRLEDRFKQLERL